MTELVLLVVAAAWLAVLIPPMLRSRVDNRPNSSVTDFRRQLTKLQDSATPARGAVRTLGRPLAQAPRSRPVQGPGQPTLRSGVTRQPTAAERAARSGTATMPARTMDPTPAGGRYRAHGDPTGGQRRHAAPAARRDPVKQRRTNVLFLLAIATLCTGFLAATTGTTVMVYAFVLAALALGGYVYLLVQNKARADHTAYGDWVD